MELPEHQQHQPYYPKQIHHLYIKKRTNNDRTMANLDLKSNFIAINPNNKIKKEKRVNLSRISLVSEFGKDLSFHRSYQHQFR